MNLARLLEFIPLIIGVFLAYHLVFKKDLPSKGIVSMLTYILGIVIVLFAARWLVTTFVADWATDLLRSGTQSTEWQQFIDASGNVVDGAFSGDGSGSPAPQPTPVQVQIETIVVTAVPPRDDTSAGQSGENPDDNRTSAVRYTVQMGDTLTSIASRYNVTVQDIMRANNLYSADFIQQGQFLIIPAPTK
jgi:LysM repeat protein